MTMKHHQTNLFYEEQASHLIERYDSADMSTLHRLFLQYIPPKGRVLDVGFGSGRDLQFLHDRDFDIWGIDPTTQFIGHAEKRFPHQVGQFACDRLPFESDHLFHKNRFDAVAVIAVWMHLPTESYAKAVDDITSVLKPHGVVIISYSKGIREHDDGRFFEEVDQTYIDSLFEKQGFTIIDDLVSGDSLERTNIQWVTVVYRYDRH